MASPPGQLPLLLDEVLSLLPPGLVCGRRIAVTALGRDETHPDVLPLRLTGAGGTLRLIVKRVSQLEYETHTLLSKELPHIVPHLYVSAPDRGRQGGILVMRHYRPTYSRNGRGIDRAALHHGLRALAVVHKTYMQSIDRLRLLGLTNAYANPSGLAKRLSAALEVLPTLSQLLGVAIDVDTLHRARDAIQTLKYSTTLQEGESRLTLVHGDFHFDNILRADNTSIRIADWGRAAIQSPAWDLVLCGEREIDVYLSSSVVQPSGFYEALRTAVLYRMADFVVVASGMLLRGATQVRDTLPFSLQRLVEAATASEFRGGCGVRFVE